MLVLLFGLGRAAREGTDTGVTQHHAEIDPELFAKLFETHLPTYFPKGGYQPDELERCELMHSYMDYALKHEMGFDVKASQPKDRNCEGTARAVCASKAKEIFELQDIVCKWCVGDFLECESILEEIPPPKFEVIPYEDFPNDYQKNCKAFSHNVGAVVKTERDNEDATLIFQAHPDFEESYALLKRDKKEWVCKMMPYWCGGKQVDRHWTEGRRIAKFPKFLCEECLMNEFLCEGSKMREEQDLAEAFGELPGRQTTPVHEDDEIAELEEEEDDEEGGDQEEGQDVQETGDGEKQEL